MASVVCMKMKKATALVWLLVAAGVVVVVMANIHLVYVAFTSQPDCVPHLKSSGAATGTFRAAKSGC